MRQVEYYTYSIDWRRLATVGWIGLAWLALCLQFDRARAAEQTPSAAASAEDDQTCLGCHGERDLQPETERGKTRKLQVPADAVTGSVHEGLRCTQCHGGGESDFGQVPHNQGKPTGLRCADCHKSVVQIFEKHLHGGNVKGKRASPGCADCHGDGHQVKPLGSPGSPLSPAKQHETCGRCHQDQQPSGLTYGAKSRIIAHYLQGAHGQALTAGRKAATCSDCHGSHAIGTSGEPESPVSRAEVTRTCGRCHESEAKVFAEGSHGKALLRGNPDVPNCVTCHGDHDVLSLRAHEGRRSDFAATQVCSWCHGNARMMDRYGLDTTPVESYLQDFHGLTQRGTAGASATCADCHHGHLALTASDPRSYIHPAHRAQTCGKCHGETPKSFYMSFSHKHFDTQQSPPIKRLVVLAYYVLILVTIGGMTLHNLIIWGYALRRKARHQRERGTLVRLTRFERIWHLFLFVSFALLVLTGFQLRFAESFWARWLSQNGMDETVRAWVHRLSAAALIVCTLWFAIYQIGSGPGRRWWREMWPRFTDLRDFYLTMKFYLGLESERPRYGVFSYVEKAEYWALVWGTLVMIATGLMLWFPRALPEESPSWLIDLARTIHFYEAVLASLAIVIWHFFHTVFKPGEYPMDTTWITGALTEEEGRQRFTQEALESHRQWSQQASETVPPADASAGSAPVSEGTIQKTGGEE